MIQNDTVIDDELDIMNHGMTETMVSTIEKSLFDDVVQRLSDISNHALYINTKYNEHKMVANFIIIGIFVFLLLVISQNPIYDY
jgi:hypothetical protein